MSAEDDLQPQDNPPPADAPPAFGPAPAKPAPPPPPPAPAEPTFKHRMQSDARAEAEQLKGLTSGGGFMDFLNFRTLIFPTVAKYLYLLATLLVVLLAMGMIGAGMFGELGGRGILVGLLVLILGPIAVRVNFELTMVVFSIFNELKSLNSKK